MKIYATRYMSPEFVKKVNIPEYGEYVWTPYLNIKEKYRNEFDIDENEEYASVTVWVYDIDEYLDDPYNYEYCMGGYRDEYMYKDFISELIKPYNHYLVCAYHCTWDGANGYKITDSLEDALSRDYNYHQYFIGGSRGGKTILLSESSHDVPMGHSVMIIGLTNKEYEKLSYWDVDFKTIFDFAERNSKSIIEI